MGSIGIQQILVVLFLVIPAVLAWAKIFSKAGYTPWLALTLFVPLVNVLVMLWFAFSEWPVLAELARLKQQSAGPGPTVRGS